MQSFCLFACLLTYLLALLTTCQVENLMGLNWFFQKGVFLYAFVSVTTLTVIYLSICPTDKRAKFDDDDDPPI